MQLGRVPVLDVVDPLLRLLDVPDVHGPVLGDELDPCPTTPAIATPSASTSGRGTRQAHSALDQVG